MHIYQEFIGMSEFAQMPFDAANSRLHAPQYVSDRDSFIRSQILS